MSQKQLFVHDLYESYPQYLDEMHWVAERLGRQKDPDISMIVRIAANKAIKRRKLIMNDEYCSWMQDLYHVIQSVINLRNKYGTRIGIPECDQIKKLPF